WGLPPSQMLKLPEHTNPFTETITMPIMGSPQRYPLDVYMLRLAEAVVHTNPDGTTIYMTAKEMDDEHILIAVNEKLPRFWMKQPSVMQLPEDAQARGLISAISMKFVRPLYLPLVSGLLVSLILISSVMSTVLQGTGEVFLGIGSIILGVWGISSIVVQTAYKGLTFIDLSLATVIMVVLLGITIRGALVIARRPG
ncbi:MAG: hypothetical protein ACR2J8_01750, partial [Thermomicrobiales bacterium]